MGPKKLLVLFLCLISYIGVECFGDFATGPERDDPYAKQAKLLISNNYYELMTVYDPVWLANLWPKLRNGVHLHVEDECWKNMTVFFQDMLDGRAWALNTIDATGSFSSGLLWGNNYWIGSQSECNDLNKRYIDMISNGSSNANSHTKYVSSLNRDNEKSDSPQSKRYFINPEILSKMILLDNTPPFQMAFSAVTLYLNVTKTTLYSSHSILMGVCLPRVCKSRDVHEIIDFSIKTYQNLRVSGTLPRSARVKDVRILDGGYNVYEDSKLYLLCSIILLLIILILIGTIHDITTDANENVSESIVQTTPPTFKSFIKIDDSNDMRELNKVESQEVIHNKHLSEEKTLESFHTFDELIPNRYTELVSGVNFIQNGSKRLSNDHINLVTVKKVNDPSKITLDMLAMHRLKSSTGSVSTEYKSNKQKYVISSESSVMSDVAGKLICWRFLDVFPRIDRNCYTSKLLIAFSLKFNIFKIFSMDIGEDTLAPVHGLKVIIILWTILIQTCLVSFQLSDNKVYGARKEKNHFYLLVKNSTYLVDTFFVLSGLLLSYFYCQTSKKSSTSYSENHNGIFGKLSQLISIITYKYGRFVLPYIIVIFISEIISKHFYANYILDLPGRDNLNCEKYWWRNILYINTFYPLEESCAPWSWYLADDMQLYIIGLFVLTITIKHFKTAIVFFSMLFLTTWAATAIMIIRITDLSNFEDTFSFYNELYNKSWTHIGPYLVGMCSGWILSKCNCCLLIPKSISFTLWLFSIAILSSIIYGVFENQFGLYASIVYQVFSHTAWGIAISWIVIASTTGYGGVVSSILSYRRLYPFSRLSYSAFLIHPILLKMIFISSGYVQHISAGTTVIFFLGFVLTTFISSLILSLLFEAPSISLLKIIHPLKASFATKTDNY